MWQITPDFLAASCTLLFTFLFIRGCAGSWLRSRGFLQSQRVGDTLQLRCRGFALWRLLFLQSVGSRALGLQQLGLQGLVGPWYVGSSPTRDHSLVPCIGRQILNQWSTREVQGSLTLVKRVLCLCPVGSATMAWWSKEENSARTHWNGFLVKTGRDPRQKMGLCSRRCTHRSPAQVQEASICLGGSAGLPRNGIQLGNGGSKDDRY